MLTPEARKERVIFFIPTLDCGGAERACVTYLNYLKGFRPFLAVQFKRGPLLGELTPDVPVFETVRSTGADLRVRKQNGRKLWSQPIFLLSQAHRLKKLAEQNNCKAVVSFITMPNIIAIFAKLFFDRRLKVIINVHDVTSRILEHSKLARYERVLLRWLIRRFYPRADVIVAVAHGIKRDLIENFRVPPEKIAVIYNPIDVQTLRQRAAEPVEHSWFNSQNSPLIVAVGRLVKLKGFELLIRAFAQLPQKLNARLIILGDGEERQALQKLIEQLGLSERVALLGFQENPWKYMACADLFVLSSLTEGLPNVIGEAMALGVPIVATDCSDGVREYLNDGQAGLLVASGSIETISEGLLQLLTDQQLRQRLASLAAERVKEFELSRIIEHYEAILKQVVTSRHC